MNQFIVVAENLNVRREPSLAGDNVIGTLKRGTVVDRIDGSGLAYWYKIRRNNGLEGWASHKYLSAVIPADDVPWLTIALGEVGVKELAGAGRNNQRILEYLRSTTLPAQFAAIDETHWCSAFVNWCVERAGFAGTDSAWARSWEHWGKKIESPRRGCIAVFSRDGGGHVGFYVGETETHVKVLGGNQSDAVNESPYPKQRLLGYRLP